MLFYLDNWLSTRDDLVTPGRGRRGLNENYARELMELHTLGVDGGYTQQDVIEVARCFTGWTIDRPQQGGGFVFRPYAHDRGAKRVLGTVITTGGGQEDGLAVIGLLSRHPSTARFISTKLVRRFVTDDPPRALVERAARTFQETDGDIRAVLVTIFTSPEFVSADTYRAKTKTPLEVVASAVRALDGRLDPPAVSSACAPGARGRRRPRARPSGGGPRRPALRGAAADRLCRRRRGLGEHGGAAGPDELRPGPVPEPHHGRPRGPRRAPRRRGSRQAGGGARPDHRRSCSTARPRRGRGRCSARSSTAPRSCAPPRTTAGPRNTDVEKLAALVLGSPEFQRR